MRNFNEFIKNLKSKIGVDLLGIVKADPMIEIKGHLENNKKLGFSTEFETNDIGTRIDPSLHLENPKSIFVIGMSYYWKGKEEGRYKISNHSQGRDYHKVLREKLEGLKEELSKEFIFNSYLQVDSGDLYEKELGRKAGFGYLGKNSLLINPIFGSYIFLGILVTDIELNDYSKESWGSCGDCNICQVACPPSAILGDYRVNSKLCHSYLTQFKEQNQETENIKYAYGCDICQKVCPKNSDIKRDIHLDFKPRLKNFDGEDIEKLSNREFKEKYKDYSFSWIGKKRIIRNIQIIESRG